MIQQVDIQLPSLARGMHLITTYVVEALYELPTQGLLHLFIKHTSAGICINENADPTVRMDFEAFLDQMVPENSSYFKHTFEGPDDMPAHIKSAYTGHDISIPITNGKLNLGTWQGIYLCEFRNHGGKRKMVATIIS